MKHNYLKSLFLMLMMCVGMSAWGESVTFTFSTQGYTNGQEVTEVTINKIISLTFNKGTGSNASKYYTSGTAVRVYGGNTIAVTASNATVTGIEFTFGSSDGSNAITANVGSFKSPNWSGSANAVTFTIGGTTGNRRISAVKVTYTTSGDPTPGTPTITAPTFDVAAGTYTEDQLVLIDNYDENYLYAYTTDGTDPAFDAKLDVTSGTLYDKNKGVEITSSCTLKVIAVDEDGNASSITSADYVINKPIVFASLEELVAADLATGTNVTVSFENVAIKSIFTSSQSKRQGVYFDIQKDGHDIEIYYSSTEVPTEWVVGGTLSGTMTCPWTYYERGTTWELAPASEWAWTSLTYTAPSQKTITGLEVSGTPTKTTYNVGDTFDPAGLTVTATYSDETSATITEGIEWRIDPENLVLGTTSVNVMAGVGSIVSEIYTVNGLTVTKPDYETATYNFTSFTSGKSVDLTDLDDFLITLNANDGTPPAWNATASQARIYAGGSLTVKANNAIIKSIEYDYVVNANSKGVKPTIDSVEGKTNAGTWDAENKTWTGADEEVTFATSGSAGNVGFTKLIIKYVEKNLIETSLAWSADEAEVTIGAGDNVFPTLTTTPTDLNGVTFESSNTEVATIAADGTITLVKAGETTITAKYNGDAEHASATPASYTLTVNKAPFVPTPSEDGYESVNFKEVYSSLTGNDTETIEEYQGTSFAMAFAKPQSSTNPTKYFANGTSVRAYKGNTITITGAENITYVDIAWSAEKGEDKEVKIDGLGTTTAVVTFNNTCSFTDITVYYCPTLSITSAGYATYYNASAYKMPNGVEGKIMKEVEGTVKSVVAYEAGAVVPAETALLLKGKAGNYPLIPTSKEGTKAEGNLLKGNLTEGLTTGGDADAKYYKFAKGDNGLGWYYGSSDNTDGHAFTIGANKAYLVINGSSKVKALSFVSIDDNEEVAIKNVEEKTFDTVIYDMQGRKVSKAQKGLYIVNGKKYMVK